MAAAFFAALSKSACKLSGSPAHALASVNALENASLRRAASSGRTPMRRVRFRRHDSRASTNSRADAGRFPRINGKRRTQHFYQRFRNFSGDQLRDRQAIARFTIANLFQRLARVWCQTGERKPERAAQRIDVRARIYWAASKLLRAGERRCADEFSMGQIHFSPSIGNRLGQARNR